MAKRDRIYALAGAIVFTLAMPIALAQGYFRYNAYLLPALGLAAILLYLVFALTSSPCKKIARFLYSKNPKISLVGFIIVGLVIIGSLVIGGRTALQKSKDHIHMLQEEDKKANPKVGLSQVPTPAQTPKESMPEPAKKLPPPPEGTKKKSAKVEPPQPSQAPQLSSSELPYIGLKDAQLLDIDIGKKPIAKLTFKNFGTPAHNTTLSAHFFLRTVPLTKDFNFIDTETEKEDGDWSHSYFPPGDEKMAQIDGPIFDEKWFEAFNNKKLFIYIWGKVKYFDGKGGDHYLEFCGKYNQDSKLFEDCPFHNSSDVDISSNIKKQIIPEVQTILPKPSMAGNLTTSAQRNLVRICKNHFSDDFPSQGEEKLKIYVSAVETENGKQFVSGIFSTVRGEQEYKLERFTRKPVYACMIYETYSIRVTDIFSGYDCAMFQALLNVTPPCKQLRGD